MWILYYYMTEVIGEIIFAQEPEVADGYVKFKSNSTPSDAYDHLKEAVSFAKYHEGYSKVNLSEMNENLIRRKIVDLGEATYRDGEVTSLNIKDQILKEYGVRE